MSKKRRAITPSVGADKTEKQEQLIQELTRKSESVEVEDEKGTVRITIDIPKPFHKKLKKYTKSKGQSIKGFLLWLASEYLDERESS